MRIAFGEPKENQHNDRDVVVVSEILAQYCHAEVSPSSSKLELFHYSGGLRPGSIA